jgi:hypothetical protein
VHTPPAVPGSSRAVPPGQRRSDRCPVGRMACRAERARARCRTQSTTCTGTQRRLRALLCGLAQPAAAPVRGGRAARATLRAPSTIAAPADAGGTGAARRAARPGQGDRRCLALRTLSEALCDEADAARVRRQVRCGRGLRHGAGPRRPAATSRADSNCSSTYAHCHDNVIVMTA